MRTLIALAGDAPAVFALQSTVSSPAPPSPWVALVALVGLALVGAVVGAVGSAVARRLSNPVGKYRLLYAGVLVPLTLVAYVALAAVGLGVAVVGSALPLAPSGPVGSVLADFVAFLGAGVVFLAAYAPTVRGVRAVRDVDLSTPRALGSMARYVVGVAALLAAVLAPLGLTAGFSPLVATLDLAVLGVVLVYGSPWLLPLLRTTRRPTGAVADRLDALRERAGLDVRDVRVLDTDDQETATTVVRGPPGYRRLFVSTTFLDCFDDDTAAALLAVDAGRVRAHTLPVRVATVFVAGLALVASVTGAGLRWPLLGVALGVVLAGFWLSRRAIRAADDYAAVRVGPDALAAALERYAEVHAMEPTRRRLPNPLSVNVALGDRLDRLEDRRPTEP